MKRRSILRGLFLSLLTTVGFGQVYAQNGFDPQPPSDPQYHYYYPVTVSVSPEGAGRVSVSGNGKDGKYEAGTNIWINTSGNTGYVFTHWEKDGEFYSDKSNFNYVMGEERPNFVAFYTYDPNAPSDPENTYQPKKRLYLTCTQNDVSFNLINGAKQVIGQTLTIEAYPSTGYVVTGWYMGDSLISAVKRFQFVMPDYDVTLRVEVEYRPAMPGDPASQGGDIALESDNLDDIDPYSSNSLFYFEKNEKVYTGKPFELSYFSKFNPQIKVLNGEFATGVGSYTAQVDVTIKNDSIDTHRVFSFNYKIVPAPLTLTAENATKVYGAETPALTYRAAGFVNNENVTDLVGKLSVKTDVNKSTVVGDYPIVIDGVLSNNYDITFENGTFTVTKAPLTITAKNVTIKYGDELPAEWGYTIEGFVNGETEESLTSKPVATVDYTGGAGEYVISIGGAESANYEISYVNGTLTVEQSKLILTVADLTKVYGEVNPELGYTVTDTAGNDMISALVSLPTLSTTATAASGVGEYEIKAEGATSTNYAITVVNGKLTVTKAPLVIAADTLAKTYGSANPELTYTINGFVNGDKSSVLQGEMRLDTRADEKSPVGTYDIIISGVTADNYDITFVNSLLTVNKAPLKITVGNLSIAYGDDLSTLEMQFTYEGFVNNETTDVLTSRPTVSLDGISGAVGTYALVASGAEAVNYEISYVNGILAIGQSVMIITVDNVNIVYGDAIPEFSYTVTDIAGNDLFTELETQPTLECKATAGSGVGEYDIIATGAVSQNYSITVNNGKLTISQADLVITANDFTRAYGYANPNLTYTIEGLVNGDDLSVLKGEVKLETEAGFTSPVDTFDIVVSGVIADNYKITFVNGKLIVTKAPLVITVENVNVAYGFDLSNYEFQFSYMGFMNNETADVLTSLPTVSLDGISGEIGTYALVASGASADNYEITYVDGLLAIGQSVLILAIDNVSMVYGDTIPAFNYTVKDMDGKNMIDVLEVLPKLECEATTASGAGEYTITATGASSEHYSITVVDGKLTINKAPLTITVKNVNVDYGYDLSNYEFEFTYEGFVNGETVDVLTSLPTVSLDGISGEVGTYALVASGASADNYEITYVDGLLAIGQSVLVLTVDNVNIVYGEEIPEFTYTVQDMNGNDMIDQLITKPTLNCVATAGSGAGEYVISASGATSGNYSINVVDGKLTIAKAPLLITPKDIVVNYGDNIFDVKIEFIYEGFVNGDTEDCLIVKPMIKMPTNLSSTGEYDLVAYGAQAANYEISYGIGKLTIDKLVLFLAVKSVSREYGEENPKFEYAVVDASGTNMIAALSKLPEIKCEATAKSPVGYYDIIAEGAESENYSINVVNGKLQVTPATLTVTAQDAEFEQGAELSFSYTITGFKNGEDESVLTKKPVVTCRANASSPAGTYEIIASGAEAANYVFVYVNGTLNLTTGVIGIEIEGINIIYDITGKKIDASIDDLKPGLYIINGRKYVVQ